MYTYVGMRLYEQTNASKQMALRMPYIESHTFPHIYIYKYAYAPCITYASVPLYVFIPIWAIRFTPITQR